MVLRKKCIKASHQRIYKEGEAGFDENFCVICGAPLIEYEEVEEFNLEKYKEDLDKTNQENSEMPNSDHKVQESVNNEKVYYITENNNIRFYEIHGNPIEIEEVEDTFIGEPRVLIYKKDKIVKIIPITYDETLIGRKSLNADPEIDLSFMDEERYTSRKHALIYIKDQSFYIKRLSVKNSLHVNLTAVTDEDIKLNNEDMIVLSRKFALEFRM
ncbi:FHA domain-containing protein [Clostridium sp. D43t1_170807_H7]|uniref:FHA domain-containing protein n=1 Tax=Clostridium sp. D43t1_170807_H7 TaxID=2787140 RepID=UPI0018971293|nr:FHA domain-containing protein [Clostridium sp. D43t1_170807_H7]